MAIHSETFTSLIEFVRNHLVKIEFLCHYQTLHLRYHDGSKVLGYLNRIVKYLSDKADLKNIYLQIIKIITTTSSNPIQLQLNNE